MKNSNPCLQLGSLSNLRKLCIERLGSSYHLTSPNFIAQLAALISQCPNLTHLEIDFPYISITELFRVINADETKPQLSIEHLGLKMVEVTSAEFELSFKHLKALKHFGLHHNNLTYRRTLNNPGVWDILRREKIILSTILTDLLESQELGLYLRSFRGLEKLHLCPVHQVDPIGLFDLLQIVHLQHSSSLVELDIDATDQSLIEWRWPFDEASIGVLPSFPNLKNFGVTFGVESSYVHYSQNTKPASGLIVSMLSFLSYGLWTSLRQKTLLDVCLQSFPKLQQVVIHIPDLQRGIRPHFHHGLNLERPQWLFFDVHEAIQEYPIENHYINSMPVIKCQSVVYHAFRSLATGIHSYVPARPILFDDHGRSGLGYWRLKDQI
jgi:hypothetical protein